MQMDLSVESSRAKWRSALLFRVRSSRHTHTVCSRRCLRLICLPLQPIYLVLVCAQLCGGGGIVWFVRSPIIDLDLLACAAAAAVAAKQFDQFEFGAIRRVGIDRLRRAERACGGGGGAAQLAAGPIGYLSARAAKLISAPELGGLVLIPPLLLLRLPLCCCCLLPAATARLDWTWRSARRNLNSALSAPRGDSARARAPSTCAAATAHSQRRRVIDFHCSSGGAGRLPVSPATDNCADNGPLGRQTSHAFA